jgi:hypothetical protein
MKESKGIGWRELKYDSDIKLRGPHSRRQAPCALLICEITQSEKNGSNLFG